MHVLSFVTDKVYTRRKNFRDIQHKTTTDPIRERGRQCLVIRVTVITTPVCNFDGVHKPRETSGSLALCSLFMTDSEVDASILYVQTHDDIHDVHAGLHKADHFHLKREGLIEARSRRTRAYVLGLSRILHLFCMWSKNGSGTRVTTTTWTDPLSI